MSLFKSGIWFVKGLKEYTKGGFVSASKQFNPADLNVNRADRSYMVTGANSGLGKVAALEIAKKGGTVHIVCRNKERGEQALKDIIDTSGNQASEDDNKKIRAYSAEDPSEVVCMRERIKGLKVMGLIPVQLWILSVFLASASSAADILQNVHLHQLDTSRPRDIYTFVQTFESQGYSLDVLINNAGCMVNTREVTQEGYEMNFATNTLGTHILTTALVPLLLKSSQPRVIIVSSGGMLTQNLDMKDLQFEKMKPFDGTVAYAQNKRQQIVMTEQYAKQFPGIHFSSMHPGWADTPGVRTSIPQFYEKMKDRLRSVEEGADTIVWLAIADAVNSHPSGLFFQDRKPVSTYLPLTWSRTTPEQGQQLMSLLDDMAKQYQK